MKTTSWLKTIIISASFLGFLACSNSQKPADSKNIAEEQNEAGISATGNTQKPDAQFLVDAAEINLEEIQLGQLAQQKSSVKEIKDLGRMMEKEHTQSLNDLSVLAKKKMISIPTSPTDKVNDEYKKLNDKSEKDFNKDFCDMMVNGHKKAISKFEDATKNASDADVRSWAVQTLPKLRSHLDHSVSCQKDYDNMNKMNK